jgi:hypothetical protein
MHYSPGKSRLFDRTYLVDDSNNERWVYEGLVVAVDSTSSKYVPYSSTASYGTGSDTAVGVLVERYNLTLGDKAVAPAWHANMVEDYCYIFGAALGSIPAAVKTSLDDIEWT